MVLQFHQIGCIQTSYTILIIKCSSFFWHSFSGCLVLDVPVFFKRDQFVCTKTVYTLCNYVIVLVEHF